MKKEHNCLYCGSKNYRKDVILNEFDLCGAVCRFCGQLDKIYQMGNYLDEEKILYLLGYLPE